MSQIRCYRDLVVWQKAMDLVVRCYEETRLLPKQEQFGLVSQIQRAAVSIPANIAEGHGRSMTGHYLHHLAIAHGSLMELETHWFIAERLHYLDHPRVAALLTMTNEIGRMLHGLMNSLRQHSRTADS